MQNRKQTAKQVSELTQKIRNFFTNQNFLEVQTPILTPKPGMEPYLTPFETTLNIAHQNPQKLFLNTSPELQMKKLLGEGFGDIFNITKVFRDCEINGPQHNPEFTMIEWYRENANYLDLMTDCENLITTLNKHINPNTQKFLTPWPRKTTQELFLQYLDIDLLENKTFETFKKTAQEKHLDIVACETWDEIYFKLFLNHIEPNLPKDKPIFIYDYPATQAALAKKSDKNPFFAERFELYINGIELCNAFSELTDPIEQRQRLTDEQIERKNMNKTVFDIDEEFLSSLESIQSPCAGIAMGLDRLFMILLDKASIEDLLLFPLNKMINQQQ